MGKQKPYSSKMEKFNIIGRSSRCLQSTDKHFYLSHSLLVTIWEEETIQQYQYLEVQ